MPKSHSRQIKTQIFLDKTKSDKPLSTNTQNSTPIKLAATKIGNPLRKNNKSNHKPNDKIQGERK